MGIAYIEGAGGGGVHSTDVTAKAEDILAGKYDITTDSDDEVVQGTMPNRGTVNHTLPVNGSFTIQKGYHSGSGKVTQNVSTKAGATYGAKTTDQTVAANQYLTGAQVFKAVSQSNLSAANVKNGVTVTVSSNGANLYSVVGTYSGTKQAINATAFRGFGLSSADYVPSEEASFTMPQNGVVYYGGISTFYGGNGVGTVEIYKNGTLVDNRNSGDGLIVRATMINKSFAVSRNDVITVKATASSGSATLCFIQAVCIY